MTTAAAARTVAFAREVGVDVYTRSELLRLGCTPSQLRARIAARRWQRAGRAVVLHGGALTPHERRRVAVLNCGPRAILASFSAAEELGLEGWERDAIHVLAPAGVTRPRLPGISVVLHRTGQPVVGRRHGGRCQDPAAALVLAGGSFVGARPACGILAAGVQQRLVAASDLRVALAQSPRLRHLRAMTNAVDDIAMGSQALSEIDFVRLCRRQELPIPVRQAVRVEPSGRRRYLDAEWRRRDGRRVVAEVDGAVHLSPRRWWDDQLRQNEVVLDGSVFLRYPSVVVRAEELVVAHQLRRALFG